ncbi:hypothetical protein KL86PLE_10176 [uncultured Pleomorphomonas sp.]|uniref:Uncharacterized protein n=1 Tax=uncultured Pleomorphomonas sp. TaxID=442121 RepID=A0A212KZ01_9HYPH|nr:hypothetical protein KL86PLE_10176 [uncultured Pleomorphomonas sp.]
MKVAKRLQITVISQDYVSELCYTFSDA